MAKRYTKEWKENISKSLKSRTVWNKGKKFSYKPNLKLRGRTPWNKGKKGLYKHSEETKKKMRKSWSYEKNITPERNKKISKSRTGLKVKWKKESKKNMAQWGEKNPNWKKGKSFEPYSPEFNKKLKNKIRKRDNYQCQQCGEKIEKQTKKKFLTVHHINYDKKDCNENNLISLCNFCNSSVNTKRNEWEDFFKCKIKLL